jgi:hypothetical protein
VRRWAPIAAELWGEGGPLPGRMHRTGVDNHGQGLGMCGMRGLGYILQCLWYKVECRWGWCVSNNSRQRNKRETRQRNKSLLVIELP